MQTSSIARGVDYLLDGRSHLGLHACFPLREVHLPVAILVEALNGLGCVEILESQLLQRRLDLGNLQEAAVVGVEPRKDLGGRWARRLGSSVASAHGHDVGCAPWP